MNSAQLEMLFVLHLCRALLAAYVCLCRDERIRIRALNAKIRSLESQNVELTEKLRNVDGSSNGRQGISTVPEQCNQFVTYGSESPLDEESVSNDEKDDTYMRESHVRNTLITDNLSQSLPNMFTTLGDEKIHIDGAENCVIQSSCRVGIIERSPEVANLLASGLQKENAQDRITQTSDFSGSSLFLVVYICLLVLVEIFDESVELEDLKDELKIARDSCKFAEDQVRRLELEKKSLGADFTSVQCRLEAVQSENEQLKLELANVSSEFELKEAEYIEKLEMNMRSDNSLVLMDEEVQVSVDEWVKVCEQGEFPNLDQANNNSASYSEVFASNDANSIPGRAYEALDNSSTENYNVAINNPLHYKLERAEEEVGVISGMSNSLHYFELIDSENSHLRRELQDKESKLFSLQSEGGEHFEEPDLKKDKGCLTENIFIQTREEFAAAQNQLETVLRSEFAEREVFWQNNLRDKDAEMLALQQSINEYEDMATKNAVVLQDYEFLQKRFEALEAERDDLTANLNSNEHKLTVIEEEKGNLEQLLMDSRAEYSSLKHLYSEVRSNLEIAKQQLHELDNKMNLLAEENEAKNKRINELGELEAIMLKASHANENDLVQASRSPLKEFVRNNVEDPIETKPLTSGKGFDEEEKCPTGNDHSREKHLSVTEVFLEYVPTTSVEHRKPDVLLGSNVVESRQKSSLEIENVILRECVAQNTAMQDTLSEDVDRLLEIKTELETTVETLKGEIWSLDARLKATIADRDNISDNLCTLTQMMEEEREKVKELERKLKEQKDFAEQSLRQATLAEKTSNQQLAECQEKNAKIECQYTQLLVEYDRLNGDYRQMQEAYYTLHASFEGQKIRGVFDVSSQEVIGEKTVFVYKIILTLKKELENLRKDTEECFDELKNGLLHFVDAALSESKQILSERNRAVEAIRRIFSLTAGGQNPNQSSEDFSELIAETVTHLQLQGAQLQELYEALEEKRAVCGALERRLEEYEGVSNPVPSQQDLYISELEGMLAAAQNSLKEQVEKTKEVQKALEVMESLASDRDETKALAEPSTLNGDPSSIQSTSAAVHMICRGTQNVPCSANLQLAILAARLTTTESDHKALLRCNEELVETNLKLQNELDALNNELHRTGGSSVKVANAVSSAESFDNNEDGWSWDAISINGASADSCNAESDDIKTVLKQLQSKEEEIHQLQEREKNYIEEINRRDKRLQAAEEYGFELEEKLNKLESAGNLSDFVQDEHLDPPVKESNKEAQEMDIHLDLKLQVKELQKENKRLLLEINQLQEKYNLSNPNAKSPIATDNHKTLWSEQDSLQQQMGSGEVSCNGNVNNWCDCEIDLSVSEEFVSPAIDVQELKATILKLNEELAVVTKSREALEKELSMSNERSRIIQSDFEKLRQRFLVCKEDLSNVQLPSLESRFALDDRKEVSGYVQDDMSTNKEMHLNEESFMTLDESEKSLRHLLEIAETKLHSAEEYSASLKEKNATLESAAAMLNEEVASLKSELKNLQETNVTLQLTIEEANKKALTAMAVNDAKKSVEEELLNAKSEIGHISTVLETVKKEKKEANAIIESMLLVTKRITKAAIKVDVSKAVEQLESHLTSIMDEKSALKRELDTSVKQNELLKDCESRLTEVVNDYETKMLMSADEIRDLRKSVKKVNDKCIILEKENKNFVVEKEQLQETLNANKQELQSLSAELSRLKKQVADGPRKKSMSIQTSISDYSVSNEMLAGNSVMTANPGSTGGEYSSALRSDESATQIKELEAQCGRLVQDKKRLVRRMKQMQIELTKLKTSQSIDYGNNEVSSSLSLSSESSTTPATSALLNLTDFSPLFAMDETRPGDLHTSGDHTNDEDKALGRGQRSAIIQGPVQRLSAAADEPVRRRRSGFRNDTGK
uniref:Girdin-like n=1 Tax=Syphacia muris TaxID=451379 RepID=A0A158R489_9BILA